MQWGAANNERPLSGGGTNRKNHRNFYYCPNSKTKIAVDCLYYIPFEIQCLELAKKTTEKNKKESELCVC